MNHREITHPPVRRREALGCLALMLLAPTGAAALPRPNSPQAHGTNPANLTNYLPVLGAPQLRFQPKPIMTEPVSKPASETGPTAPTTSSSPTNDFIIPQLYGAADPVKDAAGQNSADTPAAAKPPTAPKPPPAILYDDLRPATRAEDFLPYFQMPGSARSAGDVNLLIPAPRSAPAPAAIPPSSATYTQTPK